MRINPSPLLVEAGKLWLRYRIAQKADSPLMCFLAFVLKPIIPDFMEDYVTTVGRTIYWNEPLGPHPFSSFSNYKTLCHELVHVKQHGVWGFLFFLGYLFPLPLATLSLLSLLSIWFGAWHLLWLSALIFLLPLPAPFRAHWEAEAYGVELALTEHVFGVRMKDNFRSQLAIVLSSSSYYWMCSRKYAEALLKRYEKGVSFPLIRLAKQSCPK